MPKLVRLPSDAPPPRATSPVGSDASAGDSDWLERTPSREDSPLLRASEETAVDGEKVT